MPGLSAAGIVAGRVRSCTCRRTLSITRQVIVEAAAPPLDCSRCRRRLGKTATHFVVATVPPSVLCGLCFGHHSTHAETWPRCRHPWHRASDHAAVFATRAAAHIVIADGIDPDVVERKRRMTARIEAGPDPEITARTVCREICLDVADEFERTEAE
jgi:hypothetical protein